MVTERLLRVLRRCKHRLRGRHVLGVSPCPSLQDPRPAAFEDRRRIGIHELVYRRPVTESDQLAATRDYYDELAATYENYRDGKGPGGYHDLVDKLEVSFLDRFAHGRDVLEVGCGTGLLLRKIATLARSARGIDLSEK